MTNLLDLDTYTPSKLEYLTRQAQSNLETYLNCFALPLRDIPEGVNGGTLYINLLPKGSSSKQDSFFTTVAPYTASTVKRLGNLHTFQLSGKIYLCRVPPDTTSIVSDVYGTSNRIFLLDGFMYGKTWWVTK